MEEKHTRRNFLRTAGAAAVSLPIISLTASAATDFVWPMTGYITSPYGPRGNGYHYGVDIGYYGEIGHPIYAARSGTAYTAEDPGGYGNYIYIQHDGGYVSEYGHLNSFGISHGQYVGQGDYIGGMGADGNAQGAHLHFEVERNGGAVSLPGYDGQNVTAGAGMSKDFPGIGGDGGGGYSWPIYSNGDQGEAVYSIQYLLEHHDYNLQYHDGIYGSEVTSTVQSFQSANGLSVDGVVGPNTWSALIVTVQSGSAYWPTYAAQHHLRYDEGHSIAVDGVYGPETQGAIESFQSGAGLTVDGIVGPNTWQALVDIGN